MLIYAGLYGINLSMVVKMVSILCPLSGGSNSNEKRVDLALFSMSITFIRVVFTCLPNKLGIIVLLRFCQYLGGEHSR